MGRMAPLNPPHVSPLVTEFSRRKRSRLKTSLPARIVTLSGSYPVVLRDVSVIGARFELAAHGPAPSALEIGETVLLQWCDFEKIGQLVWEGRTVAGLTFEEPVSAEEIIATREQQDAFVANGGLRESDRDVARSWVRGLSR